ncbi:MAG TPA: 30S ribosomal protein S9 [Thermomicrobiales bacterium]|nr:30S ribosomal protein S9 [Thermomicrobiales bacterium]
MVDTKQRYLYGTGRRKSAVARVRMYPGSGSIEVNGKEMTEYFGGRGLLHVTVLQPLVLTEKTNQYDIVVKVVGGGTSGQAGAVRHGIARALTRAEGEELRGPLKSAGLLTRDARVKERKKVGLKRARKAPQYTKR